MSKSPFPTEGTPQSPHPRPALSHRDGIPCAQLRWIPVPCLLPCCYQVELKMQCRYGDDQCYPKYTLGGKETWGSACAINIVIVSMLSDCVPAWLRRVAASPDFSLRIDFLESLRASTLAARWTDIRVLPLPCTRASGRLLHDLLTANINGFGRVLSDCVMNVGYPVFKMGLNLRDNRFNTRPINEPSKNEHETCRQT